MKFNLNNLDKKNILIGLLLTTTFFVSILCLYLYSKHLLSLDQLLNVQDEFNHLKEKYQNLKDLKDVQDSLHNKGLENQAEASISSPKSLDQENLDSLEKANESSWFDRNRKYFVIGGVAVAGLIVFYYKSGGDIGGGKSTPFNFTYEKPTYSPDNPFVESNDLIRATRYEMEKTYIQSQGIPFDRDRAIKLAEIIGSPAFQDYNTNLEHIQELHDPKLHKYDDHVLGIKPYVRTEQDWANDQAHINAWKAVEKQFEEDIAAYKRSNP